MDKKGSDMNSKEAIEYLRSVTAGDTKAKEALDVLALLSDTATDLAKLHEAETTKDAAGK
jgi:hypothetical protein